MNRTRTLILLILIVTLAVALRVTVALVHPTTPPGSGDAYDYHILGTQLAASGPYFVDGHHYVRMPGYPALLAIVFAVTGPSDTAALVAQSILGGLMVLPVFFLARRINAAVALLAALLAALDPLSIAFSAALLSETAFTGTLLLSLWVAVRIAEKGRFGWWILLGLLGAVSVYLRASALYLIIPLALVAAAYGKPGLLRRACGPLAAMLIMILAILPWQLTHILQERAGYLALTSLEGISLYEAVYPDADGSPRQHLLQDPPEMQPMNEMQRNDAWSRQAWSFIRQDPGRIASLALRKMARTWNPAFNAGEMQSRPIQCASLAWHVPLFLLAICGLFTRLVPLRMKCVLLVPLVYFTLVHALYLGSVRYRVPLMPLVCIFAAAGAITLWSRPGHKPTTPATV